MATFYVDTTEGTGDGPGTADQPCKTINQALNRATAGDVILVHDGVYREQLTVDKSVTITAAPGATPELDGGYSPRLFGDSAYVGADGKPIGPGELPSPTVANKARGNWVIAGPQTFLVSLRAPRAVLQGITVRNVAGRGIAITGDGAVVRRCRIDFTWGGAVLIDNCTDGCVEECVITRSSVKYFDPHRVLLIPGSGPEAVQVTVVAKGHRPVARRNIIAYNFGEGIAADKEAVGMLIEGNICHTNLHWSIGVNGASNTTIRDNTVYWCSNLAGEMRRDGPTQGITLGDETPTARTQSGPVITGNLVVAADPCLLIGNGRSAAQIAANPNYWPRPFQIIDGLIAHNTFVGGPEASRVVHFGIDAQYPHRNAILRDNIFWKHPQGEALARAQSGWNDRAAFRRNAATTALPADQSSPDDIVAPDLLANAGASITGRFSVHSPDLPDVTTDFNPANYAATAVLRNKASDGTDIGVALRLAVEPPEDPHPQNETKPQWFLDFEAACRADIALLAQAVQTASDTDRQLHSRIAAAEARLGAIARAAEGTS